MTSHASNGTSYLSTKSWLDETNKKTETSEKKLESSGAYCYIQDGQSYTLYAKGYTSWFSKKTVTITDGTNTVSANGINDNSSSCTITSHITVSSSAGQ